MSRKGAYYNEHDKFAAAWLRELIKKNLIAPGDVDERDIQKVKGSDLDGYTQVHFFAGIGGWSYALRLSGWDDSRSVWTGSCPCQPFSAAGKRQGEADARHLWPEMRRLIAERSPAICFGEQVASDDGCRWLAGVFTDMEELEYRVAGADLCAASVAAPHARQRLWWLANAGRVGRERWRKVQPTHRHEGWNELERLVQHHTRLAVPAGGRGAISDGIPAGMDIRRCFGNAIVPQVAARFIEASVMAMEEA